MVSLHTLCNASAVVLFLSLACSGTALAREIESVKIEKSGIIRPESEQTDEALLYWCKRFRPTLPQVRRYFSKAVAVPAVVSDHDRYSACAARGTIKFKGGFRADWILYSDGSARIDWEAGGYVYLLFTDNKWYDPFGPYDKG
jgi:hypothetical protein